MNIEWNKVTWYSKIIAVVLFVLVFYVGFRLGKEKKDINGDVVTQDQTSVAHSSVSITKKDIKEENFSGTEPVISGSGEVAVQARTYIDQTITDFRKRAGEEVPDMRKQFGADSPTANYEIDIDAKYLKSEKTESLVILVYVYTGGAHGSSLYKVFTASVPDDKILPLSGVIKHAEQTTFTDFVKKELIEWHPDGSEGTPIVFVDDVKNLTFDSFKNWSLDDKNLTIYFDQYEIGPGALGEVAFPLPIEKIKNFLESAML